jgi:predicted nucleic acid-binding Zn ribbon protein
MAISLGDDVLTTSVLGTILPLAAFLGSTGEFSKVSEFFRKYIYMGKTQGGERPEASRGRPRVQVTGPKVQQAICQICLGKIKEGTEYVKCSSGKVFHSVCLARVGNCPYCQRTIAIKGKESTTSKDFPLPTLVAVPEAEGKAEDMKEGPAPVAAAKQVNCPICGSPIDENATGCACGAIFVPEGGNFPCPACGAPVKEGSAACSSCGESFDQVYPLHCPVCGRIVPANAETCECGAILNNRCPECGAELAEDDSTCRTCGTEFDFV